MLGYALNPTVEVVYLSVISGCACFRRLDLSNSSYSDRLVEKSSLDVGTQPSNSFHLTECHIKSIDALIMLTTPSFSILPIISFSNPGPVLAQEPSQRAFFFSGGFLVRNGRESDSTKDTQFTI